MTKRAAILAEFFDEEGNSIFAVLRIVLPSRKIEQKYLFDNFDGAILKFGDIESDCEVMAARGE